MSDEIEFESIPGLPGELPPGERVLWQGKPQWKALARQAFGVRLVGAYLAIFAAARLAVSVQEGQGVAGAAKFLAVVALSAGCLGLLSLMAWVHTRATVYTITNRRVVMRVGVAIPMTWNLPFRQLTSADVKIHAEGEGDIVLQVPKAHRIPWLFLWPHAAPWHAIHARPTLRAIAEPQRVSTLLADAVQAWATAEAAPVVMGAVVPTAAAPSIPTLARPAHNVVTEAGG